MISRNQRIEAFAKLGNFISSPDNKHIVEEWVSHAYSKNNWFTPVNCQNALNAIATEFLDAEQLAHWVGQYPEPSNSEAIGVVMAGNIPAVGFHDALCILISGHILMAKLSSEDGILIRSILEKLIEIEPAFASRIIFVDRLNDASAFIATGSDNTARYFHYYFAKKPNIIRKNRTSVAVLTGKESKEELALLGNDILKYFGLGCRNVSKLYVPEGYDFTELYEAIQELSPVYMHHHKYFNNYEYNKSIVLINLVQHFDNGFLIITENPALVSPISVLHYENYVSLEDVASKIEEDSEKIQCVVGSHAAGFMNAIKFGDSQNPGLSDYADNVDTMKFLSSF